MLSCITFGLACIERVLQQGQFEKTTELVNATNNRHLVSTDYAALHLSESERSAFHKHMGHSQSMNENVYQTPLAIMGITTVAKNLMDIQTGKHEYKM